MTLLTGPDSAFWSASFTSKISTGSTLGHNGAYQGEVAANDRACAEPLD